MDERERRMQVVALQQRRRDTQPHDKNLNPLICATTFIYCWYALLSDTFFFVFYTQKGEALALTQKLDLFALLTRAVCESVRRRRCV